MLTLHNVVNQFNLSIANRFIEDDVPTIAYEVDTTDEVFNLKLTPCTATKTE
jgi:hypothetical protein